MYAFCTYCSREKNLKAGAIPAIQRYLDERIHRVYSAASRLGLGFFIVSGEFGLIPPGHLIPWYDHLLRPEEVSGLVEPMAKQIVENDIAGVVYFTEAFASDPNLIPYHDALVAACSRTSRPCFVVEVEL